MTRLVLLFSLCFLFSKGNTRSKVVGNLERIIGLCPEYEEKNVSSYLKNIRITTVAPGEDMIDYDAVYLKDMPKKLESSWHIQKCSSKENPDSCYHYKVVKTNQFCTLFLLDGQAWSKFLQCAKPKWSCPFKKGTYYGRNCTLDTAVFQLFPLQSGDYWKIRIEVKAPRNPELLMCIMVEAKTVMKY